MNPFPRQSRSSLLRQDACQQATTEAQHKPSHTAAAASASTGERPAGDNTRGKRIKPTLRTARRTRDNTAPTRTAQERTRTHTSRHTKLTPRVHSQTEVRGLQMFRHAGIVTVWKRAHGKEKCMSKEIKPVLFKPLPCHNRKRPEKTSKKQNLKKKRIAASMPFKCYSSAMQKKGDTTSQTGVKGA